MKQLSLAYPVQPHRISRGWGVVDPVYEREFGFTRHNGIDIPLSKETEVRAPLDGKITLVGNKKSSSGGFVCLVSKDCFQFPDGKRARVELTFMHLSKILVHEGARVQAGDVLAQGSTTDRSGESHLHLAPKRVKRGIIGYRDLDTNDANNTFDPTPFWSGGYAAAVSAGTSSTTGV